MPGGMRMKRSRWVFVVACLIGCAAGTSPGGQGGAGGSGGSGGTGGGGGGADGSATELPAYQTTNAKGKIAGKTFEFVTGFVKAVAGDASAMDVELLAFSPELNGPCWNQPPAGSNPDLELRVIFRVPRTGGSFTWGGGQSISGFNSVTLASLKTDGSLNTLGTDRAKVTIGPWPTALELTGSMVVQADASNTLNGTFTVYRCN